MSYVNLNIKGRANILIFGKQKNCRFNKPSPSQQHQRLYHFFIWFLSTMILVYSVNLCLLLVIMSIAQVNSCRVSGGAGFCIPTFACTAQGLQPEESHLCGATSFVQCCPGYRPTSCKAMGSTGRCIPSTQCRGLGGTSIKSTCGGPDIVQCCVFPRERIIGSRCSVGGRIGYCRTRRGCAEFSIRGVLEFHRSVCRGLRMGCCIWCHRLYEGPCTLVWGRVQ